MSGYTLSAPVDCTVEPNTSNLKGKTAIVTGGANGLGQAYVRALAGAGVNVCIGDLDTNRGKELERELPGTKFVSCNTANWDDQVRLFNKAALFSPTGRISYVVANAGIHRPDEVFAYDGDVPRKPDLTTLDVNINGTLYTAKLAMHYFIKQNGQTPSLQQEDTALVLIGSGAAFLDCPRTPQYDASKWAMRGIMHSLRRTAFYYGSRVNVISPWYVRTSILSKEAFDHVESLGVEFAKVDDAGECLLRILSDTGINGRSLFVTARKWADRGYMDLDIEDYRGNELLQEVQTDQIKSAPVENGLFL
ncbi:hypothetical protein BDV12DRAFT_199435 [Aspergillus spectabilis]